MSQYSSFARSIHEIGYSTVHICLKNDQEPAIKAVIEHLRSQRTAQTLVEESPVGSSQSNGSIESAIGEVEAQIRTGRLALENNFMVTIQIHHPIIPWLVMHSGFVINRFLIGHDGQSPYQRIRRKPFDKPVIELGETVWYKKPKNTIGPGLNKYDSRWGEGIFSGCSRAQP